MKRIIFILTVLVFPAMLLAQPKVVSGKVTDKGDGSPLIGVTVIITNSAGDSKGVTTNLDGDYSVRLDNGENQISFQYIGMTTVTENIGSRTVINAEMESAATLVDEVVVVALGGERQRRSLEASQQSVNAEQLTAVRSPDFISSLSGKVAGMMVNPAGQNTGSGGIVLRSYSSATSDNNAIFVIDGVIMENGSTGGETSSLDFGNGMGDINPNDIESIEVLKGPNATALYGSRASNGVIMITTKKSSGSGIKLSFQNSTMFQRIAQYPEYQNTFGVGMDLNIQTSNIMDLPNPKTGSRYRSWGPIMLGQPYIAIDGVERPYLPQPNNIRDFYQSAILLTNNVTIEGGSKDSNMRLSYTNYYGNSVVEGLNKNMKNTINVNLNNKFTKWFTLSTRVNFVRDDVKNRQYLNANSRNPVNAYVHMARSTSLDELRQYKDENGYENATNRNMSNPYWLIYENPTQDVKDRLSGNVNARITLPHNIVLMGRASAELTWMTATLFQNLGGFYDPAGRIEEFTEFFSSMNLEGTATWTKNIRNTFSIQVMAGASSNTRARDKRTQTVIGLVQPDFIHISNSTEKITPVQDMYKRRTNSVYGSVSLGYKSLLYLNATARNDWSSTLPIDNCSFFYPSIGTSFVFSELLKDVVSEDIITSGKLRLSFAQVGNDTSPYRIANTYAIGGIFNGDPYANVPSTMNNPDLKPEITQSYEAGLEMSFFKDRLNFDLTWYRASTFNQIVQAYVSPASGYQRRYFNAGEIRNSGIELSLHATPVRTKKFSWSTDINFSKNNSMVVSLLDEYNVNSLTLYSTSNTSVNVEVGKPYAYIRGVGVLRNEKGEMIMADGASPSDFESVPNMGFGSASPDWLLGYNNTFSYKGFSFSFLIDVRYGGIMYSNTYSKMMTNGMTAENYDGRLGFVLSKQVYNESDDGEMTHGIVWNNAVQRVYGDDGVTVVGYKPVKKFFTPSGYEYTRSSINEFSIFDATFVKLREVTLSYQLPRKWLEKTFMSSLNISLVGRNVWTIYQKTPRGVDPESGATSGNGRGIENGSLPPIATYGFNISFTTK